MKIPVFCSYPFLKAIVTSDGSVSMCSFQQANSLGSLIGNTFDEVWHGEKAEEIRKETYQGNLHSLCQTKECPFLTKALVPRTIEYNEYPAYLEIRLPNTSCNINPSCIMCERSNSLMIKEVDLLDIVLPKLKHIMHNIRNIKVGGTAEPFWNGNIFRILDTLNYDLYKEDIVVETITNGSLLDLKIRSKWLDVSKSSMTFSLDASTPDTYYNIRGFNFETVLKNLHAYSQERGKNQFLKIRNNINTMNVQEVIGMVQIGKSANVDLIEFEPTVGFRKEILVSKLNAKLFKRAQLEVIEEANRLGQNIKILKPLDLGYMGGETLDLPNKNLNKVVQIDLSNIIGNNPDYNGRKIQFTRE